MSENNTLNRLKQAEEQTNKFADTLEGLEGFSPYIAKIPRLEPLPDLEEARPVTPVEPKPAAPVQAAAAAPPLPVNNYLPNVTMPNTPTMKGPSKVIELADTAYYWKNIRGQAQSFSKWTAINEQGYTNGWHDSSASGRIAHPRKVGGSLTLKMQTARTAYKCDGCERGVKAHEPYLRTTDFDKITYESKTASEQNKEAGKVYCKNCARTRGGVRIQLLVPQDTSKAYRLPLN
jgi:hypothetical protein